MRAANYSLLKERLVRADFLLKASAKGLEASSWIGSRSAFVRGLSPLAEGIGACLEDRGNRPRCLAMLDGFECLVSFFGALAQGPGGEQISHLSGVQFGEPSRAFSSFTVITDANEYPVNISFKTGFAAPKATITFYSSEDTGRVFGLAKYRIGSDNSNLRLHLDASLFSRDCGFRKWLGHLDLSGAWFSRKGFAEGFLADLIVRLSLFDRESRQPPDLEPAWRMALSCCDRRSGGQNWEAVAKRLKEQDPDTHALFRYNLASLLSRAAGRILKGIKNIWLIGTVAGSSPVCSRDDIDLLIETYGPDYDAEVADFFEEADGICVNLFNELMSGTGVSRGHFIDTAGRILTQKELETRLGVASIPFSSDIPHYRLYPPPGFRN